MRLFPSPPPRRRPARRAPSGRAGVPGLAGAHLLAADSISQVISNTTVWIVGILAGLATLFLTIGGVRYLIAGGDPAEVEKAKRRSAMAWPYSPRSS